MCNWRILVRSERCGVVMYGLSRIYVGLVTEFVQHTVFRLFSRITSVDFSVRRFDINQKRRTPLPPPHCNSPRPHASILQNRDHDLRSAFRVGDLSGAL